MGAPLPKVVQWFKTMTTNEYIRNTNTSSSYPHGPKLWQRNYYEHVIRNERTLNSIREYIQANPANWADDPDNPNCRQIGGPSFHKQVIRGTLYRFC
jgi:putative transposase